MTRSQILSVKQIGPDRVEVRFASGHVQEFAAHVWNIRQITIRNGLEMELKTGMRLTGKVPSCFTIIREEYGIRAHDKLAAYKQFCQLTNQTPRL